METGYKNLGYFFLFLFVFIFFGFYETYFGLIPHFNESTTPIVHFHAFTLFLWTCLVIIQPLLIRAGKYKTHKILGRFSYVLVPTMILSFVLMWQKGLVDYKVTDTSLSGFVSYMIKDHLHSLWNVFLIILFYSLAIYNKQRTPNHMRYMIATTLIFIDPTLSRAVSSWFHFGSVASDITTFLFTDSILVALIIYDIINSRTYKPYVIALSFFLIYHVSFLATHH